jgi:H+/Cl- antiporter ClcA
MFDFNVGFVGYLSHERLKMKKSAKSGNKNKAALFLGNQSVDAVKSRTYLHASVWTGAIIVGLAAVLYARAVAAAQEGYFKVFHAHPLEVSIVSPLLFVLATFVVGHFAPEAKGSGIPQVLEAIEAAKKSGPVAQVWQTRLVSLRTTVFKVISSLLGILGGASIGREGPTVQIAASGFAWVGRKIHRWVPQVDFETYLIAGAAAGVAAAFNTPLAGITFALEEVAEGAFGPFRQTVMLTVIISGITAQAFLGDYLYFGHPKLMKTDWMIIPEAIAIGGMVGLFGGWFARLLAYPGLTRLPKTWWPRALVCGILCSIAGYFTHGDTAGSGYEVTRITLESGTLENVSLLFPLFKLATTVLSYLSGMAGGIFSPCLAIGAGLGISIAKLAHFANFQTCALIGMVAFFSGVVQAPLTAVIIVMEMTDEHILILPFMVAAFIAQGMGKWLMPVPLYAFLARREHE